jgi:signal transduction histidine kinase
MELGLVDQIVAEEMEALVQRVRVLGAPAPPEGPNLQYYVLRTPADYEQLAPALRSLPPGQHEVGSGVDERYIAVRDLDGVRYMVSYDAGAHQLREQSYKRLIVLALASAALVAVVLGYWLAGVLTRQLTQLASQVARLAPDERHPPLERADHDREVAALAHALDGYHVRIIDMIQREQEFTSNASHELRAPRRGARADRQGPQPARHGHRGGRPDDRPH